MSTHPFRVRTVRRLPRTARVMIYATVLAGMGMVATFYRDAVPFSSATANANATTPPKAMMIAKLPVPASPLGLAPAATVQIAESTGGGKLMICGGGKLPETIRNQFCKLAGGKRAQIVVIPTATSNAEDPEYLAKLLKDWRTCDVGSVNLLHTRSRELANDAAFVKPLTEATGVWLTGGDQVWLTDAYLGTAVQNQLKSILARGGVIAGTSAGAAVMSGVMIAGGMTKADVSQGFDFIKGAVIDQHFLKRNRMDRLIGVLSSHPKLVGLGIDEETALVVDVREHHLSVIGASYVVACVPDVDRKSVRLQFLKAGDQLGMADLRNPPTDEALAGVKSEEPAGLKVGAL